MVLEPTARRRRFPVPESEDSFSTPAARRFHTLPGPWKAFHVSFRCSLLVVDDEPDVLTLLEAHLANDFEVILATSAQEARAILTQRNVDIVLSDQNLLVRSPSHESKIRFPESGIHI